MFIIWKLQQQGESETDILHLLIYSPNTYNNQGLPHRRTWAIRCCLRKHDNRKLDQNWSSQDTNWLIHMGCQWYRQKFSLLHHNTNPVWTLLTHEAHWKSITPSPRAILAKPFDRSRTWKTAMGCPFLPQLNHSQPKLIQNYWLPAQRPNGYLHTTTYFGPQILKT